MIILHLTRGGGSWGNAVVATSLWLAARKNCSECQQLQWASSTSNDPYGPKSSAALQHTVPQLQVLNEVLEKAQGELRPQWQWHKKEETLEQETAHCLILNSRNPQEPLRQSVPEE